MTHVSKHKILSSTDKFLDLLLESTLTNIPKSKLSSTLPLIISETEMTMIKKRLGIILLLSLGYDTNVISEVTKTTRQTIVRIKFLMKSASQEQKSYLLKKLKTAFVLNSLKEFMENIDISQTTFRKKISPW